MKLPYIEEDGSAISESSIASGRRNSDESLVANASATFTAHSTSSILVDVLPSTIVNLRSSSTTNWSSMSEKVSERPGCRMKNIITTGRTHAIMFRQ